MSQGSESMQDTARKVETHFNKSYKAFDAFYDHKKGLVSRIIDGIFRRSMRMRFEKVMTAAAPYENRAVLDVGCGTGRYSLALAMKGIRNALGIDFAGNMIAEANARARQFNVHHICRFVKADFMEMNIEETYDHVFAMGVLDYIRQPVPFVKKMVEVAKKSVMISFPSRGGVIQWARKQLFRRIKKCPVYFYRDADVHDIARQAGARRFTVEKLARDYFLTIYTQ